MTGTLRGRDRRGDQRRRVSRSRISAEPDQPPVTCLAGQPMLMSMMSAPAPRRDVAASRHPARLAPGELNDVRARRRALGAQARLLVAGTRTGRSRPSRTRRARPRNAARGSHHGVGDARHRREKDDRFSWRDAADPEARGDRLCDGGSLPNIDAWPFCCPQLRQPQTEHQGRYACQNVHALKESRVCSPQPVRSTGWVQCKREKGAGRTLRFGDLRQRTSRRRLRCASDRLAAAFRGGDVEPFVRVDQVDPARAARRVLGARAPDSFRRSERFPRSAPCRPTEFQSEP